MEIDLTKRYTLRPGVVYSKRGDLYFIIDLVAITTHLINKASYEVLKLLNGKYTLHEVIRKLQLKNRAEDGIEEKIVEDTIQFVKKLSEYNLVLDRNLNELLEEYRGSKLIPGLMYWEVTNACNFKCLMCYNFSGEPRKNELTLGEGIQAIDEMKKAGVRTIIFTGGEPLLRKKELMKWIETATRVGISTQLFTNGSCINKETVARLKKCGLGYARVSMQGATKKAHEATTQVEGSYKKSLDGMKNLIESEVPTCWSMTTNKINFPELRMTIEEAMKHGCHGIRFGSLDIMGKGVQSLDVRLDPIQELSLWRFMEEAIIVYGDKIKIGFGADLFMEDAWEYYVTNPVAPPPDASRDAYRYMRYVKNSLCGVGIRSAGMTSQGYIVPCPALAELEMGHILKDDLTKVWNEGEFFQPFRKYVIEQFEKCGLCGHRYLCIAGCRANAYHQTGSLIGMDKRRCDVMKEMNKSHDLETIAFFDKEELDLSKYKLNLDEEDRAKKYYGPKTEGAGPWIPYTAILFRKKEDAPELFLNKSFEDKKRLSLERR